MANFATAVLVLAALALLAAADKPTQSDLLFEQQHRPQHQHQHSTDATLQRHAQSSDTLTACFKSTKRLNCRGTNFQYLE